MPFFVEVTSWGLKKIMTSPGRDRDWAKTAIGITGLSKNFVGDGGIEEPYWGPSHLCMGFSWFLGAEELFKGIRAISPL